MVSFAALTTLIVSALLYVGSVSSVALNGTTYEGLGKEARDVLARATPAAPHFVVYADAWDGANGVPAASALKVGEPLYLFGGLPILQCLLGIQCLVRITHISPADHPFMTSRSSTLSFLLLAGPWDKVRVFSIPAPFY